MAACLMLDRRLLVIRLFPGRAVGFLMIGTLRLGTWMRVWVLRRLRRVGAILARLVICGRAWWIGGLVTIFRRRVFLLAVG